MWFDIIPSMGIKLPADQHTMLHKHDRRKYLYCYYADRTIFHYIRQFCGIFQERMDDIL